MKKFNKNKFILFKFTKKFKKNNPFFLYKIKSELISTKIIDNYIRQSKFPDKILSQILFKELINENFNEKIFESLLHNKKLIYPLPVEWCKSVNKKIKVNFLLSSILFYIFAFKFFLKSFLLNMSILFKFRPKVYDEQINIFFDLTNGMNFHLFSENENFFKKFDKFLKKDLIIHDNYNLKQYHKKINYRVLFFKNFIFVNNNVLTKIKLLLLLLYYSFLSLIFLLFGKVSRSFLFDDKIKTIYLNENKFKNINLFFNNSTLIHRHLWTYPEFHKSINSYVYYYSSNVLALLITEKEEKIHSSEFIHFYNLLTWDKYLTNSDEQDHLLLNYLDKRNNNYKLEKIGIVPFEGKKFNLKKRESLNYLSLFEVTPFKPRRIIFHENPFWYYNYQNTLMFYKKLINYFSKKSDWKILVKKKRLGDKKININLLYPNVKMIDPSVSAIDMVKKSDLVISMPYTTPTFFARENNIPSFFFDSTGTLKKDHINNKNIPLLSQYSEIDNFLMKNNIKL